jgi:hypothetical protein
MIDTDAVQVHYEQAQNIIGSSTKMTMGRTETWPVSTSVIVSTIGGGGVRVLHVREQHLFLYHQGRFHKRLNHGLCIMKSHGVCATIHVFRKSGRIQLFKAESLCKMFNGRIALTECSTGSNNLEARASANISIIDVYV